MSLLEVLKKFLKYEKSIDWMIVKDISLIIEKGNLKPKYSFEYIKCLLYILIKYQGTQNNEWYCACE